MYLLFHQPSKVFAIFRPVPLKRSMSLDYATYVFTAKKKKKGKKEKKQTKSQLKSVCSESIRLETICDRMECARINKLLMIRIIYEVCSLTSCRTKLSRLWRCKRIVCYRSLSSILFFFFFLLTSCAFHPSIDNEYESSV